LPKTVDEKFYIYRSVLIYYKILHNKQGSFQQLQNQTINMNETQIFLVEGPTDLNEVKKMVEILMDGKKQNIRGCRETIFVSTIETISAFLKEENCKMKNLAILLKHYRR